MKHLTLPRIGRLASVVAAAAAAALAACAAPPGSSPGSAAQAPASSHPGSLAGHDMPASMPMQASAATAAPIPVSQPAPNGKTFKVKIANFVFVNQTITVPVGSTVTWVNEDDIPHTVVSDDHTTFKSKVMDTDDTFTFTFTKAGDYSYFCSVHPHMTGKVIVTPN